MPLTAEDLEKKYPGLIKSGSADAGSAAPDDVKSSAAADSAPADKLSDAGDKKGADKKPDDDKSAKDESASAAAGSRVVKVKDDDGKEIELNLDNPKDLQRLLSDYGRGRRASREITEAKAAKAEAEKSRQEADRIIAEAMGRSGLDAASKSNGADKKPLFDDPLMKELGELRKWRDDAAKDLMFVQELRTEREKRAHEERTDAVEKELDTVLTSDEYALLPKSASMKDAILVRAWAAKTEDDEAGVDDKTLNDYITDAANAQLEMMNEIRAQLTDEVKKGIAPQPKPSAKVGGQAKTSGSKTDEVAKPRNRQEADDQRMRRIEDRLRMAGIPIER